MYGKSAIAPCGHAGETIIGTYVKCLSGCDHVKKPEPVIHNKTNFSDINQRALADYANNNPAPKRGRPNLSALAKAPSGTHRRAPKETDCRLCKRTIPFLRMSNVNPTKAIYECLLCRTLRTNSPIRTILQGPYDGGP